ncbi:MAG: DUF413 domain-containing protein [Candidatus Dasytiphilus stammeri]
MTIESFFTKSRFFDNKHYPRGFSRYGDFTIKESKLLERYGYAFNELDLEKRDPINIEEQRFVEVCRGKLPPETDQERVWIKYITRIKRPKRFHTLSGGTSMENLEDYLDNDD